VQVAKSDPEAQRKSSLSDCTWLEKMSLDLNSSKLLKFLMHFREPVISLYFIFIHTHIFFLIYIFLYTHFFSFSFFLYLSFFICST
jgi:hypothetical protein